MSAATSLFFLVSPPQIEKLGYLVTGGFGHSRFAEALFGGVTRRLLAECEIPLFLAHWDGPSLTRERPR